VGCFFGAPGPPKLVQTVLRYQSVVFLRCEQCNDSNDDWLCATRSTIIDIVLAMEKFVQLPAYELVDGK
jgi:hypothetical protein